MEKRPKPIKVVAEAATPSAPEAAALTSEPVLDAAADSPAEGIAETSSDNDGTAHDLISHDLTPAASDCAVDAAAIAEVQGVSEAAVPAVTDVAVGTAVAAEVRAFDAAVVAAGEAVVDSAPSQAPSTALEPELVDVWRSGGRSEERRGQRRPPRRQRVPQTQSAAPAQDSMTEHASPGEDRAAPIETGAVIEKPASQHRRRRERDDSGERRRREHRLERQGDRPERPRVERLHSAKSRIEPKDHRDYAPRREREKQPDPDSPFAKLAALKAQLEANAKERR